VPPLDASWPDLAEASPLERAYTVLGVMRERSPARDHGRPGRQRLHERVGCRAERIRAIAVAERRPPERNPAAGAERAVDLREAEVLVHPVEGRCGSREAEVVLEVGVLERALANLDAAAEALAEETGESRIGLDRDERAGAEVQQAPRGLPRPGADLEHLRP
jgi:hypothetical protein